MWQSERIMITIIANKEPSKLQNRIELISQIKKELRSSGLVSEICKENGFGLQILDGISIEFVDDLGVSAKTIDSSIKLSSGLIDEEFEIMMRYAIHELVHALQHMKSMGTDLYEGDEYLDRADELEAFQYQIEYEAEERGMDQAEEYVKNLVEYHEIPEEDREEKENELLERAKE